MGLTDLFRPKYRHSDADKRVEAIREMGLDEAALLARIAREDRVAEVRRIAIDKLEEPSLLAEISADESDSALREHTRSRAAALWISAACSASGAAVAEAAIAGLVRLGDQRALAEIAAKAEADSVRDAAMGEISEQRAFADLARNSSAHVGTRRAALAQIRDDDTLRAIATDEQRKDLAILAVERIAADEALDAVAGKAKNKAARTRARKILSERAAERAEAEAAAEVEVGNRAAEPAPPLVEAEISEDKRRHAERVQLLQQISALVGGTTDWEAAAEELGELEQRWQALGTPDDAQRTRFDKARRQILSRRDAQRDEAAEAAAPAAAPVAEAPAPAPAEATGEAEGDEVVASAAEAADAAPAAAEQPGDEAAAPMAQDRAKGEAARESDEARSARRIEDQNKFSELVAELEGLAADAKIKLIDRTLQRAEKALKKLDLATSDEIKALRKRYDDARRAAFVKLKELREAEDWERWANVPRQEALIAKVKALLASDEVQKLGAQLKELQQEWKTIGPVPRNKSQELWDQFKSACDEVYQQVKQQRSQVNEEMQANLARKEALCERVEVLAESSDWDATAEEIKKLQSEWKAIGPVPRKQSNAVWKRFRGACDRFFERRKPHLEKRLAEQTQNLAKKIAMCEEAERLAESIEWKETAARLRDLQREWREVGLVPRKDAGAINKRFRAACDTFFKRRENRFEAERQAHARLVEGLRATLRAIIDGAPLPASEPDAAAEGELAEGELAAAAAEGDAGEAQADAAEAADAGEDAAADADTAADAGETAAAASPSERLLQVREQVRELSLSAADEKSFYELCDRAARACLEREPEAFRGTELDPATSRQRKHKLCARAEELAPAQQGEDAGAKQASTPEEMAERLRAALAQNALSTSLASSTDGRSTAETIADLELSWLRLGPVLGDEGKDLEQRFRAACERARQAVGQS